MEAQQRIVCEWCQTQNLIGATTCHSCGAPLDVRHIIDVAAAPRRRLAPSECFSAPIAGDVNWTTVATYRYCGELHAARAVLSRMNIVSRIGPALEDSPEFDLQAPAAEAGLAKEILRRTIPQATAIARPTGGFPVIMANAPMAAATQPALPLAVLPMAPAPRFAQDPMRAALWIVLALIVLSMIWACFA